MTPDNHCVTFTLPNGMRAVCLHTPGAPAEYFGVAIDAGSRDERPDEQGLAHFVEHTIFKGTATRKPMQVIQCLEKVGGELNAYTTKEETVIYSVIPPGYLNRAVNLIGDLITAPAFPDEELEREREVVLDEIESYRDIPADAVTDDFEDLFFKDSPLGHNILGERVSVKRLTRGDCLRWVRTRFVPGAMVAFYAGNIEPDAVYKQLLRAFGAMTPGEPADRKPSAPAGVFDTRDLINCHQAHTLMGAAVPGYAAGPTPVYGLLANILGGPRMNSLLNIELRERRGLVYSVDAALTHYTDTGLLTVYFGCDPKDTARCMRLCRGTVARLADKPLGPRVFGDAVTQYCGQLLLASANTESMIVSQARSLMRYGCLRPLSLRMEEMRALTPQELCNAAGTLALSSLTLE